MIFNLKYAITCAFKMSFFSIGQDKIDNKKYPDHKTSTPYAAPAELCISLIIY